MFAASKSGSVEDKDAQFNYVTMLLHGDGTNGAQNNTFVDSSTNNFTITRNGNTTQGTFTPYGSNWSNYLNGSSNFTAGTTASNFLCTGSSSGITATFEAWVYLTAYSTGAAINEFAGIHCKGQTYLNFGIRNGAVRFYWYDGATKNVDSASTSDVPLNTWTHIAVTISGSTIKIYINGVLNTTSATYSGVQSAGSGTTEFIGKENNGYFINGYISNYRLTNTVVYSAAFTPSTTPLTAVSGTALLICQSNRFIDNSSNAFAITVNSTPSVQRFSPFSPLSSYSTSGIGGSGYFDGTADNLQTPSSSAFNFSATDCTLEFWYYGAGSGGLVFEFGSSTPDTAAMQCEFSSGTLTFKPIGASSSFFAIQKDAWNYIAAVKTGTTYYLYINGTRNTSSTGTAASSSQIINIGARNGGSVAPITGYLSDFRVSNTARYTAATMTVPTAPLTAITNTSLLLNFTNAGILDNAMMNDLETVGNAQISTSVKKYGTGSLAFDGTGDRLVNLASSPRFSLANSDHTIEMWIYANSFSGFPYLVTNASSGTSSVNWTMYLTTGGALGWGANNGPYQFSGGSISLSTWTHVAICQSGSNVYYFVNGSLVLTKTKTDVNNASWVATSTISVGSQYGSNDYNGYIDDLRITNYARYTATFTPPIASFADKG